MLRAFIYALAIALLLIALSLIIEYLSPYKYDEMDLSSPLKPPSATHIIGTDALGRDVFTRLFRGLRNSIVVACISTFISLIIALALASIAVLNLGALSSSIDILLDVLYIFPAVVIALLLTLKIGPGPHIVIATAVTVLLPAFYRALKTVARSIVVQPYVEYIRCIGGGSIYIAYRYILTATYPQIVTLFVYGVPDVIMLEASLSFLGLGYRPPEPSLGLMIYEGVQYIFQAPQILLASATIIMALTLTFNVLGDRISIYERRW